MSYKPPRNHPWRGTFPEDRAAVKATPPLTAAEVKAIKHQYWSGYSKSSIARMFDVRFHVITNALKPGYEPLKES
jgi:hypothetical protein